MVGSGLTVVDEIELEENSFCGSGRGQFCGDQYGVVGGGRALTEKRKLEESSCCGRANRQRVVTNKE